MISIIISSYKESFFNALKKNIADSCGITFEIIKIDNPRIMGTSEAYNKGAKLAKYDILLFIHEDIKFESKNWGDNLVKHLQMENVGIVGVAGGNYVPKVPLGWFSGFENAFINIIQGEKDGTKSLVATFKESFIQVKAVDGVFIAVNKNIFRQFYFDEKLRNYHGYDTEISLRIGKKFQNYVISDILIEHFSIGNPDKKWFEENIYIRKKLGSSYNHPIDKKLEYKLYEEFIKQYINYYPKSFIGLLKALSFFPIFKIDTSKHFKLLKYTVSNFYE